MGLRINAEDIVYWSMSDNTSKKSLGWCFWVGTKCYDKEDIRFMIKYMDGNGARQITQIGFFNGKPAQAFASFLNAFSGLEAGVANVQGSTRRVSALDPASVPPFADVTASPSSKSKGPEHVGTLGGSTPAVTTSSNVARRTCHQMLQQYACSYQRYLVANPKERAWVEAHPGLAKYERMRLGSID